VKVVGITGGIGSGKSIVSKLLEINGIPVYNTDLAAKRLYNSSFSLRGMLVDRFGPALYAPDGRLNRQMLAERLFKSPEHRAFVSAVVHPAVEADFEEWKSRHAGCPLLAVESAILFESGLQKKIDLSLNVSAPLELRIRRTQQRDHLTRTAILARIHNQLSDEERTARANHTIVNDNQQALIPQIEKWLESIKSE
jgi:dephospho-CoA kinase